jgi:hypothetical protein
VKSHLFLACIALLPLFAGHVKAKSVGIDLGDSRRVAFDTIIPFSDLNGTSLLGQSESLDFLFSEDKFVRLFSVTTAYSVLLVLQTNGGGLVGYLDGTGFLLGDHGDALQSPQLLGSASSTSASMAAGLFPLWAAGPARPFDHHGLHFNLHFPTNPSVEVTAGELRLSSHDGRGPYGIGPGIPRDIVPDLGGTVVLLGIALAGLMGMRSRTSVR